MLYVRCTISALWSVYTELWNWRTTSLNATEQVSTDRSEVQEVNHVRKPSLSIQAGCSNAFDLMSTSSAKMSVSLSLIFHRWPEGSLYKVQCFPQH